MATLIQKVRTIFPLRKGLEFHFYERINGMKFNIPRFIVLSLGVKTISAESCLDAETVRATKMEPICCQRNLCINCHCDMDTIRTSFSTVMTFEPNDPRLRSSECLTNAACLAVDSTSAVLSQTVYAVINIEREYVEHSNLLVLLMERQLQVLDHAAEEEQVADLILKARLEINDLYKRKQDLALLFVSVTKLADATAEVAFVTGASYASTSTGERLHSAVCKVQQVQAASEEAEKRMRFNEIRFIEALNKHQQNKEKHQAETT